MPPDPGGDPADRVAPAQDLDPPRLQAQDHEAGSRGEPLRARRPRSRQAADWTARVRGWAPRRPAAHPWEASHRRRTVRAVVKDGFVF
ncbi:hypothetical protein GCM10009603_48090 [Nocardiopsis exhalans]